MDLVNATPYQLTTGVQENRVAIVKKGWLLGAGCTFVRETPEVNIQAIRQAV